MNWFDIILDDSSVRSYEFTKRAILGIDALTESEQFSILDDPKATYSFLLSQTKIIPFSEYLKRYIYFNAEISGRFSEVSNDTYKEIILESFENNDAPFSFEPTSKKQNAIIKDWLTKANVSRNTVFILGFGLGMSEEDVETFLTKVLREDSFHFNDVQETVFWYCFHNGLEYAAARRLLGRYNSEDFSSASKETDSIQISQVSSEEKLSEYIAGIIHSSSKKDYSTTASNAFLKLYSRVQIVAAKAEQRNEDINFSGKTISPEDIIPADIEKILYSSVKTNTDGNLPKASASSLSASFDNKRLVRQRISSLLAGKAPVDRFDIITMMFVIYAMEAEEKTEDSFERMSSYVNETNDILKSCGMLEIYPANPYDAFILICLLNDFPLAEYTDVLSISYNGEEAWVDG